MTEPAGGRLRFTSYEEFRDGQFEIARRIAGATRGDFNGSVDFTPYVPNGVILGRSLPDGTIELDQWNVVDQLEGAFQNPGVQRPVAERKAIRNALKTVFHEDNHLAVDEDSRPRAVSTVETLGEPGVREFEEGVTEAFAIAHLDRFIVETGFDKLVPGIRTVRGRTTYPAVAPAARALALGIGNRSGLPLNEVLARLNRADHEHKWQVATDLMYESSNLPDMATEQERDIAKAQIRAAMQSEFATLSGLRIDKAAGMTETRVRARSAEAGRTALANAVAEIDRMEANYRERGRILGPEQQQAGSGPLQQDADNERANSNPVVEDRLDAQTAVDGELPLGYVEPSPYVATAAPVAERSVEDLQNGLDADAGRAADEANPDRIYATDTLTTDRDLAADEWDRQQTDPNRRYVADLVEEPESVRAERLTAEQAAADRIDNDLDSDLDDPALGDRGVDGSGVDAPDRGDLDPLATEQWAPPAATDRRDRPALDQQQNPQQQNLQQQNLQQQDAQQAAQQRDVQRRDDQRRDDQRRDGQDRDGQDRDDRRLEGGDRDPAGRDREPDRLNDRLDREQREPAAEPDGRDSVEWPDQDPDAREPGDRQPDRQQEADHRDGLDQDRREQDARGQQQDSRDPDERGDRVRDDREQLERQQPDRARDDQRNPAQRDQSQRDPRDDRNEADRQSQDQGPQNQDREDPGRRDPSQRDQSRDDRQQTDRQQQGSSQRDQSRDGQAGGRQDPARRDPVQRDPSQRAGAQQDPRQQAQQGQQDPRRQGQQGQQGQQDPRQQGQQGRQDPRQQQGQRDPRMQAQQDPRQQAQGRQQPGQDPRQQGGAAAAAAGGGPGGPPGGPPNRPSRDGAARAQGPQQKRPPQKRSLRDDMAKKLSQTARKAPQAAEALLDAADPTSPGRRRSQSRQRSGSGSDLINKLKQLKDGGQRSPRGAGRPPQGPPKATPHGRGVHNAGQHNQKLKDQHTPQRDQGEGRERDPNS